MGLSWLVIFFSASVIFEMFSEFRVDILIGELEYVRDRQTGTEDEILGRTNCTKLGVFLLKAELNINVISKWQEL